MKRRILAMALASALALSLAACGGGNGGGSSSNPGNGSDVSAIAPGGSSSDASNPDGSDPDGSQSDGSASGSAGGSASSAEGLEVTLTLNRTDIELNKAGATFRLRYTAEPDTDGIPSFTSGDPKVATVAEDGTITAVAPGKTTITVTYDGTTATASVNCNWKVSQPAPDTSKPDASKPDSSGSGSSSGSSSSGSSSGSSSSAPAASVNLSDFYTTTTGKYQFSFMMEADETMLATFFTGLDGQPLSQQVLYLCGMSPSPHGDFALVQVSDPKNVDTVKAIFQARIDYMVGDGNGPGGAFYPMEQTMWEENARIAVNGDCVMLIVHPDCDSIVDDFNALF